MSYGNVHRFLLRTLASRGVLSYEDGKNIVQSGTGNDNNKVEDYIKEINNRIKPFQQTIRIVNDEVTSEKNLVFLSLGYDNTTKSQNVFSPAELEYFRVLIEQIMSTECRQITSIKALNLVSNTKVSKSTAENLLQTWCRMHYLDMVNSNYALGIRAIHEFENYLRENMPDAIDDCCLCKQIVFRGYNCPACYKAIHTLCLNRYLEKVQKWPCCKVDFSQAQVERLIDGGLSQTQRLEETQKLLSTVSINEQAEEQSEDEFELTQPSTSSQPSRKRKRKANY